MSEKKAKPNKAAPLTEATYNRIIGAARALGGYPGNVDRITQALGTITKAQLYQWHSRGKKAWDALTPSQKSDTDPENGATDTLIRLYLGLEASSTYLESTARQNITEFVQRQDKDITKWYAERCLSDFMPRQAIKHQGDQENPLHVNLGLSIEELQSKLKDETD